MQLRKKAIQSQETLKFNYLPAVLKKYSSGWMIEYYIEDPITLDQIRVRNRVEIIRKRYKTQSEAVLHINKIVFDINVKLAKGWNPLLDNKESARMYFTYIEVSEKFIEEKTKELRIDTIRSYKSYISIFNQYIEHQTNIMHLIKFSKQDAVCFIDYIYNVRKVHQTSYNNYVKFFRLYFNWLKSHCYVSQNYFNDIATKKRDKKKRTIIPDDVRTEIIDYLSKNDKQFLIICKLIYYSLLRPKEISMLKIGSIDFERKSIVVSESISKNHNQRFATLTDDLIQELQYVKNYDPNLYIFSNTMLPGKVMATNDKYRKIWRRVQSKLKLDAKYQFYSLRDTGIFEMLKSGIDPLSVKQHADHHSLEMTSLYSDHFDPNLSERIRSKVPKF